MGRDVHLMSPLEPTSASPFQTFSGLFTRWTREKKNSEALENVASVAAGFFVCMFV